MTMGGVKIHKLSFADPARASESRDILVNVFFRGGMDILSLLIPHGDSNYHNARSNHLAIPSNEVLDIDGYFGLHPMAGPLFDLYQNKDLALIPATGIPDSDGTRSHFQAQDYLDYGGSSRGNGGWIGRYLNQTPSEDIYGGVFRGLSFSSAISPSLDGFPGAISLNDADDFEIRGDNSPKPDLRHALRQMYSRDPLLSNVAGQTLDTIDLLASNPVGDYTPRPGVTYPDNSLGRAFSSIAQLIKEDFGLQAVTIDIGGWDTHESQVNSNPAQGYFADQIEDVSLALMAFWSDMYDYQTRLTISCMSEFGRRLKENENRGCDHGHGSMMMILNGQLSQKKIWGLWPGLETEQLYERKDLAVTTDFRNVLCEIFTKRLAIQEGDLGTFFPGFTYSGPMGLFAPEAETSGITMY